MPSKENRNYPNWWNLFKSAIACSLNATWIVFLDDWSSFCDTGSTNRGLHDGGCGGEASPLTATGTTTLDMGLRSFPKFRMHPGHTLSMGKKLMRAARDGNIKALRKALQNGVHVDDQDSVCLHINMTMNDSHEWSPHPSCCSVMTENTVQSSSSHMNHCIECSHTDAHDDINVIIALGSHDSDSLCGKGGESGLPERADKKQGKHPLEE